MKNGKIEFQIEAEGEEILDLLVVQPESQTLEFVDSEPDEAARLDLDETPGKTHLLVTQLIMRQDTVHQAVYAAPGFVFSRSVRLRFGDHPFADDRAFVIGIGAGLPRRKRISQDR